MPRYVPNLITSIRFFLVPIFIAVFYSSSENHLLYSTLIFALAGITDMLDGYVARKYDLITKLGTALDPLADKLMQLTVLITFASKGYIPLWAIVIMGVKEVLMIIGALILYIGKTKVAISANIFGKLSTVIFYVTIFTIAFITKSASHPVSLILIVATVVITVIAFINYFIQFLKIKK